MIGLNKKHIQKEELLHEGVYQKYGSSSIQSRQTEQSLDTFIGIQAMSYNDRYFSRIHKGFGQIQDTLESYFD